MLSKSLYFGYTCDTLTAAYGRSANYTYYAHQFSSQAAAAAVQQQYYGRDINAWFDGWEEEAGVT